MPYIKPEIIQEVKQMDLMTYLSNYEPDELIKKSRNDYVTKTHGSLHISNGLWKWWAQGIHGRSALDYLIKVNEMSFTDAVIYLKSCIDKKPYIKQIQHQCNKEKRFSLPRRNENNDRLLQYLCEDRCLDDQLVAYCIENHLLYERASDHAVVFLGYDETRNVRFACTRSTMDEVKKDIYGSDKQYSFRLLSKVPSSTVHVFESAIDLLSYITLMIQDHKDWKTQDFLSITGASLESKNEEIHLPIALENYLTECKEVKTIILHLDSDQAGHDTTMKITRLLKEQYRIIDNHPRTAKDVNKVLTNKCKSKNKEVQYER